MISSTTIYSQLEMNVEVESVELLANIHNMRSKNEIIIQDIKIELSHVQINRVFKNVCYCKIMFKRTFMFFNN